MRRDVCYTPVVRFSVRLKRLHALKEGFNVRNGNSLKAFGILYRKAISGTGGRRLMEGLFSALFHCPESKRE